MSEQIEPSHPFVPSSESRNPEAAREKVSQETRDELLTQLRIAEVSVAPHGQHLLNHVEQLEGIAADGGPSGIKHQAELNLLRIAHWTEKHHDEQVMSGARLHFLRTKLTMLSGFSDAIRFGHEVEPYAAHEKSVDEHWENF